MPVHGASTHDHRVAYRLGEITTGFGPAMKFAAARPYADPEAAARKLVEIANSVEAVLDGASISN
jgi:hypothetical protein